MTSVNDFEVGGYWWLSTKPEAKICGTLRYSRDEGGNLVLMGIFGEFGDLIQKINGPMPAPIFIHGRSIDGTYYTLTDCVSEEHKITSGGHQNHTEQVSSMRDICSIRMKIFYSMK